MNAATEMFATRARIIDMLNSNVSAKRVNKQIARYFRKSNDTLARDTDHREYDVVGTSIMHNEVKKLRFANNLRKRIAKLRNSNHTHINLIALDSACKKREAVIRMINRAEFSDDDTQAMIADYLRK